MRRILLTPRIRRKKNKNRACLIRWGHAFSLSENAVQIIKELLMPDGLKTA
jgi:hypothetical protein